VLAVATVEGTLVHQVPVAFAGSRRNVDLGRSVMSAGRLVLPVAVAPTTAGVLWSKEEGNVVSVRQAPALFVSERSKGALHAGGHVLRSLQRPVLVNRH